MCPDPNDALCQAVEAATTFLGAAVGFIGGGGVGLLEIAGTGGLATPAAVLTTAAGTAGGAAIGKQLGQAITNVVFSKSSSSSASGGADEPEKTAGEIISSQKKGGINRVFPEQMRGKTMSEIERLAKQGDRAARTAKKLLTDGRFDK